MNLFSYWCLSGIILTGFMYYSFNYKKEDEKVKDLIEELEFQGGLDEQSIQTLIYVFSLLLGGILLPYAIVCKVYKLITGKKLGE